MREMTESAQERTKRHEGCRFKPYKDSEGILTVGYGRNLEAVVFSQGEVDLMFKNDWAWAKQNAETFIVYEHLNEVRRGVLIEMVFQIGVRGVKKFKRFLGAARKGNYEQAHDEMIDSKWHSQTPSRCEELAKIFLEGRD
ncbi:hypothetical protein LCGC14_2463200 [marine sediment metagenome]|uniref:Lysozyme n=1 Tax=marine sediment metagenome TaxID=412755 RepID=A0A0F9E6J5_9ZZZZ